MTVTRPRSGNASVVTCTEGGASSWCSIAAPIRRSLVSVRCSRAAPVRPQVWSSDTSRVLSEAPRRGVVTGRRRRLVGDQLRLDDHPDGRVDRLDLVGDRGDRALDQGHQPGRPDPDGLPAGRHPLGGAVQQPRAEVEDPLVRDEPPVAHVERLVVDEEPDELAVGDVDERLADLGVAVAGLGIRQRARLEETVEVGPGYAAGLTLVEVPAPADVAVGQGEHRLALREHPEVEARLAQAPRLGGIGRVGDHGIPADVPSGVRGGRGS